MCARNDVATLATFHKQRGWLRFVVLALSCLAIGSLWLVFNRSSLWHFPLWFDLSLLWWCNGFSSLLFGILLGLARAAQRRENAANIRSLALTAILCGVGMILNTAINHRSGVAGLSEAVPQGELILQTSNYSCAAASGANIASLFGRAVSEKQMAEWMGTRVMGTSPAGILRGFASAGITAKKFALEGFDPAAVPVPSILLVDFPLLGPESHAIAALKYLPDRKLLEVWDPLVGRAYLSAADLAKTWTSRHGILCRVD